VGHEANVIGSRAVFIFGAALAAITIIVLLLMGGLFRLFDRQEAKTDPGPALLANTRQPTPEPHLQIAPIKDLQAIQASEENRLHSYGWVDRDNGVVRIPIRRAIELLLERDLPSHMKE
jgi:hypothetical protein